MIIDSRGFPKKRQAPKDADSVTSRKAEVLEMLGSRCSHREIGEKLGVSRSGVQRIVQKAMEDAHLVTCPHCKGTGMVHQELKAV